MKIDELIPICIDFAEKEKTSSGEGVVGHVSTSACNMDTINVPSEELSPSRQQNMGNISTLRTHESLCIEGPSRLDTELPMTKYTITQTGMESYNKTKVVIDTHSEIDSVTNISSPKGETTNSDKSIAVSTKPTICDSVSPSHAHKLMVEITPAKKSQSAYSVQPSSPVEAAVDKCTIDPLKPFLQLNGQASNPHIVQLVSIKGDQSLRDKQKWKLKEENSDSGSGHKGRGNEDYDVILADSFQSKLPCNAHNEACGNEVYKIKPCNQEILQNK